MQYDGVISCMFLEMNLNVRQFLEHVEYEPELYDAAFNAEFEICSSTMWFLLNHLNDEVCHCYVYVCTK